MKKSSADHKEKVKWSSVTSGSSSIVCVCVWVCVWVCVCVCVTEREKERERREEGWEWERLFSRCTQAILCQSRLPLSFFTCPIDKLEINNWTEGILLQKCGMCVCVCVCVIHVIPATKDTGHTHKHMYIHNLNMYETKRHSGNDWRQIHLIC